MRPLLRLYNYSIHGRIFRILIFIVFLIKINLGQTQPYHFVESHNQSLHSSSKEISSAGWIFIYDSIYIYSHSFVEDHFNDLGLGINDSLGIEKVILDSELSVQVNSYALHEYYNQYYKNLIVEGAELTVHSIDSFVYLIQGKLIDSLDIDVTVAIADEIALDSALNYIDAEVYAWEEDTLEEAPVPILLLAHIPGTTLHEDNYILCYKIKINAEDPFSSNDVYINANTGAVAFVRSNIKNCNGEDGTGVTNFYGTQSIEIRHRWFQNDFILENCWKNYHTKDFGGGNQGWGWEGNVTDNDGDYTGSINAVTAHWTAGVTHEIYDNVFGLEGMDGNNKKVRLYVDNALETGGPFYAGDFSTKRIYIGGFGQFNTLDVMAHEWTHGVTQAHSDLVYELESGALNESFSDIFGKVVEWREANAWNINGFNHPANTNVTFDWLLGNDGGFPVRSMSNPSVPPFFDPMEFEGANWINTVGCTPNNGNDQCGVHTNSGVQNHWFFLLSEGQQNNPVLTGIGIGDASRIAYRNMTIYMQENSNYLDARLGAVQAGRDLFGSCSQIDLQNQTAWSEVNIGDAGWCASIAGDGYICLANQENAPDEIGYFQVNAPDNSSITWLNLSNSWTYTITGTNNENLTVTDWGNPGPHPPCIRIGVRVTFNTSVQTVYKQICFKYCDEIIDPRSDQLSALNQREFEMYPNPAKDEFFIESKHNNTIFKMYNILGYEVMQNVISLGVNKFSLDQKFSPGIYIIRIEDHMGIPLFNEILILHE